MLANRQLEEGLINIKGKYNKSDEMRRGNFGIQMTDFKYFTYLKLTNSSRRRIVSVIGRRLATRVFQDILATRRVLTFFSEFSF